MLFIILRQKYTKIIVKELYFLLNQKLGLTIFQELISFFLSYQVQFKTPFHIKNKTKSFFLHIHTIAHLIYIVYCLFKYSYKFDLVVIMYLALYLCKSPFRLVFPLPINCCSSLEIFTLRNLSLSYAMISNQGLYDKNKTKQIEHLKYKTKSKA